MQGEIEYIRTYAIAATIRIGELVVSGEPFSKAKQDVIKKIMKHQRASGTVKKSLYTVMQSISPNDLSKDVKSILKERDLAEIERVRGKKAGWIERQFYYLTGSVF